MDKTSKQREAERLRRERERRRAKDLAGRSASAQARRPVPYERNDSRSGGSRQPNISPRKNHKKVRKGFLVVCAEIIRSVVSDITSFFSDFGKPSPSKRNRLEKARRATVVAVTAIMLMAVLTGTAYGTFWAFTNKNANIVYLNNKQIGILKKMDLTAPELSQTIMAKLKADLNVNIQTSDTITFEPVHAAKKNLVTIEYITSEIIRNLDYAIEACAIYVNGVEMSIVKDESTASDIFTDIKNQYIQEGLVIARSEFVDDVQTEIMFVKPDRIISPATAFEILTAKTETGKTYEVKSGDMLWSIADAHGMTRAEILKVNPGVTAETILKIGQTLNITVSKPLVSVKTAETIKYREVVKKETEKKQNPNEPKTYSKVIQQGSDGEREVTAERIRINGFEEDNIIIGSEITITPVKEIIEVGTR